MKEDVEEEHQSPLLDRLSLFAHNAQQQLAFISIPQSTSKRLNDVLRCCVKFKDYYRVLRVPLAQM